MGHKTRKRGECVFENERLDLDYDEKMLRDGVELQVPSSDFY